MCGRRVNASGGLYVLRQAIHARLRSAALLKGRRDWLRGLRASLSRLLYQGLPLGSKRFCGRLVRGRA